MRFLDREIARIQEQCDPKLTPQQVQVVREHMSHYALAAIMDSQVAEEAVNPSIEAESGLDRFDF
jgi:hypothetical protein